MALPRAAVAKWACAAVSESVEALVVFTPSGKRGRFPVGTPLLQAARSLGVDIDSVCGGRGICGRCQILVAEGEFAKHGISSRADSLTPLSEPEMRYAKRQTLADGRRLRTSGCEHRGRCVRGPPARASPKPEPGSLRSIRIVGARRMAQKRQKGRRAASEGPWVYAGHSWSRFQKASRCPAPVRFMMDANAVSESPRSLVPVLLAVPGMEVRF